MSESTQSEPQDSISNPHESSRDLFVVGIGASAGGLSALEELFSNLSTASGAAFVVIQHLSPDFKSLMTELLERRTSMPVYRIQDGMGLQPNSVYLILPGQNLALDKNVLRLEDRKKDKNQKHELNFPIDLFFTSLAKNYGEQSIGVILSGSGSDGTRGLKAINEAGGVALVQDPETAEFDGMPRSAIATGVVNQILPPKELSQLIYQCIVAPVNTLETESSSNNQINSTNLSRIAKLLIENEELDFSQYKSSTISRRIHRRCLIHNSRSIDDYIKLLNDSGEERQILCSDLLINVTHFFRDYPAWQNLENNILPRLIEQSQDGGELRFWITACSTGEEAYSLAILVHEALQDSDKSIRVKIFATDIDRVALDKASQGIYSASIARDIGQERLQRYFIAKDNSYQIMRKIREMLIFSPHDLTKDAGFTRINLVSCRNVLIYMKSDLQYQVLRNLHFSLVSKGILFLGEAETLGEFESEFKPLDKKWKFFQKQRDIRLPLPLRSTPKISRNSALHRFSPSQNRVQFEPILEQCLNRLSNESNSIILLISKENHLLHVSGDSDKIFKAPDGKVTTEVTKMVVIPLQLPLNTALHRAKQKKTSVQYQGIKIEYQGEPLLVSLEVIPPQINRRHGDFFLVKIKQEIIAEPIAIPATETFELGSEASRRIIELENELQQTRENLQALVEELETTNEEQQASNEELTASNEELQSTNEELHSVNEELHTVNIEYQSKIGELTQLNNDIDNLLKSTEIGVIFLDSQLRIRKFTPAATKAVSLRENDLERPLGELTMKVDCPQLTELLENVLAGGELIELEVKQKKGDSFFLMQINPYLTECGQNDGLAISFVAVDEIKRVQLDLENSLKEKNRQLAAIETATNGIAILNDYKFIYINQAHLDIFGYSQPEELLGQSWRILYQPEEQPQFEREIFPILQEQGRWQGIVKAKHRQGYTFDEELTLNFSPTGDLICICQDVSDRLKADRVLRSQKTQLTKLNRNLEQKVARRTKILANFSDRLKQLHHLAISDYETLEDLYDQYLKTGCEIFGLATGIVSQITEQTYKILAVRSPLNLSVGLEFDYRETYCQQIVDKQETIAYFNVSQMVEMQRHPVYLNLDLKSYIGTPIFVNGNLYGTLNFSSIPPRGNDFHSSEREIIELMARDIGNSIAAFQSAIALKQSEAEFRKTFEQATVGITHIGLDGKFLKVNSALCKFLGYSSQELLEMTFQDITYPEDLALDEKYVPLIMAGEMESCTYEKRYIHADGSIIWGNLTFCLATTEGGEPAYFIAVVEDISDRKEGEIALLQVTQAKDTFIAHMSHELRTPLNSIIGFSNILKQDSDLTAQQLKSVDIINQSGQHLLTLINDILDLSKLNANKLKLLYNDLNLIDFLYDIAAIFEIRAQEKGLDFITQIPLDLPGVVNTDETKLRQVLLNLLSNAIKFTTTGAVTFSVSCETIDSDLETKMIRFQVEDTGRGIPEDKYDTVFAPFGQVDQNRNDTEGTGLGLSICQNILSLMDSELHLGSKVGVGSWFWFDLELEELSSCSLLPTPRQPDTRITRYLVTPCKILVIDDNDDNRMLLVHYLQPLGFTVEEADNGKTGIAIAEKFQPDLILLDLLMPVMNGGEAIEQIRQHPDLQNTAIVTISANVHSIDDSSRIRCEGFLAKPIDLERLMELLEKHLELDWQTLPQKEVESITSNELISPSQAELINLLELVNFGNMTAFLAKIDLLETGDSRYISFAQKVRQLADNCEQDKLEKLLQTLI
ncbi:PAS domain S-box protein [Waterburya agarophytonicola K14]|uniref:Circadian input-output histidine kinase CikA n=1 Tax=Waterburya agarophytonicola KI4 TaxID=2874699 RepID=A0A964BRW4_9CYAN|nr:chemotaxis protein CheB [Waterburya agarophytonicola]MCC0177076.1 PAS domain S-box protein [Waterburya agarophytonicola KI4]